MRTDFTTLQFGIRLRQWRSVVTSAKRMGITQPNLSGMMRGDFSNLSERKLMDCLNRLGYDIEIKVKPASKRVGHLRLAIA
jgi:predicted XRE-type DNA-binding protein